jgi:phosphoglycolate phosphatase-like HAD superfamily hydrolase
VSAQFAPGEVPQIQEIRARLGLGLREAIDTLRKYGSSKAALEALGEPEKRAEYVSHYDQQAARLRALERQNEQLIALHQRHADLMVELAQELREPRLPLPTVTAITVRRLAEMAQEALAADKATGAQS